MLDQFRDYIRTFGLADYYSIGLIDNSKERSIGIYSDGYTQRVEALGKESSYDIAGIHILYHGTKNLKNTEAVARSLYDNLRYINDTDVGTLHVQYFSLTYSEPVFIGTDDNGVYEYTISGTAYIRK